MKKLLSLLLTFVMLFGLSLTAFATVPQADPSYYFYDYAGLVNSDERTYLCEELQRLSATSGFDVVAVITGHNAGLTSAEYADKFYDNSGFGENGLLLLVNMEDREVWISTCGEAIYYFTDDIIDDLTYELVAPLSDGYYVEAVSMFISETEAILQSAPQGGDIVMGEAPRPVLPSPKSQWAETMGIALLVGVGVGVVVAVVMVLMHKSLPNKTQNTIHYVSGGRVQLLINRDNFINSSLRKTRIQQDSPSSRGGGGGGRSHSSVHRSSGRSHGGGGRKF